MLSEATLQKKYGISKAKWDELFRKQHGVCAICGCHQRYQSLATDHCHKTGKVRGLLCVNCNRGLGKFFDSPIRLRNAADYIERSRQPESHATSTLHSAQASPACVASLEGADAA